MKNEFPAKRMNKTFGIWNDEMCNENKKLFEELSSKNEEKKLMFCSLLLS